MIEGQEDVTWEDWVALAEACERAGIERLFRSDHYVSVHGDGPRAALDAWGVIAALAARTTTLRLGTMVSPASFRHPSILAKLVTTADHVSGGRVELGIGTGWHEIEHTTHGLPFAPIGARMDVLEEQLAILHDGHWGDAPFTFRGEHYAVEGLDARPRPVQEPHPPLIMGGKAGPRAARLAARYADEYNTVMPTPAEIGQRRVAIAAACERAGREPIRFTVMTGVLVGADRADLDRRAQELMAMGASPDPETWVIGTPEEARRRLRELEAAGVDGVPLQHLLHRDLDAVELIAQLRS